MEIKEDKTENLTQEITNYKGSELIRDTQGKDEVKDSIYENETEWKVESESLKEDNAHYGSGKVGVDYISVNDDFEEWASVNFDGKDEAIGSVSGDNETEFEERKLAEKLRRLQLEEEMLNKENEERAQAEAKVKEKLKQMHIKAAAERERIQRLEEMKLEEERRERRLQLKLKEQREKEERIWLLQQEEERLRQRERMRQDALRRVEEIKREQERKEISLREKLKEQKERDERLRLLQQEEEKLKRQIQKEELEKKTHDERIAQLQRENETLKRQVEKDRENTPPPLLLVLKKREKEIHKLNRSMKLIDLKPERENRPWKINTTILRLMFQTDHISIERR